MCMADDPEQKVRKATIQNFVKVCETVSTEFFIKKLLPVYQKLGKDTYWPVREAAVKIIFEVSTVSTQEIRETLLVDIYKGFCNDISQFVRKAATLQLGHFLYSLKGSKINPFLIQLYVSLDPKLTADEELIYHCAYTFPAVLLSLGADEWKLLKNTYKNLVRKDIPQVRLTLAASIHEIAKIVGGKIATEDLDLILKNFLNNSLTAQLCFGHLHEFLAVLEDKERLAYLELVQRTVKNSQHNWRLREVFAINAEAYAKLFDYNLVYQKIFPIVLNLLGDPVVEVRMKMCEAVYPIVMILKSEPKYFEEAMNHITKLYNSPNFRDRQTFLYISSGFMCNEVLFDQYLLTNFLALQKDRIPSVRVSLAKILHNHMKCSGVLAKNTYIVRTIELLQNDSAKEVKECVVAASIECDKMNEIEGENMREIEKVREEIAKAIEMGVEDEEELEEAKRKEAEQFVREKMKVDEIENQFIDKRSSFKQHTGHFV
eukprot:TRINITY_DN332_c0_g1_i1.p1 TRINITY_DN332_c0_g1~~TRINITY_DN332_c0_g1_i1.p1  ORF type:complete len:487 (-),score=60.60 TRINITY_DN332_c0_g1_i1:87-1547(-)